MTRTMNTDELLAEASDHWRKDHDSNLYKLFDTVNSSFQKIGRQADKVERWREINRAKGTTLDLFGQDVQAYRNSDDDDTFRFVIFIQKLLAKAQGTAPNLLYIASTAMQDKDLKLTIKPTGPRHVAISIPFVELKSRHKRELILTNLQRLLALGYWLDYIEMPLVANLTEHVAVGIVDQRVTTYKIQKPLWAASWSAQIQENLCFGSFVVTSESYELPKVKL